MEAIDPKAVEEAKKIVRELVDGMTKSLDIANLEMIKIVTYCQVLGLKGDVVQTLETGQRQLIHLKLALQNCLKPSLE